MADKKLTWRLVIDAAQAGAGLKSFGREAKGLDTQLQATEKTIKGRFKGALSEAAAYLNQNVAAAAIAGGTALVAFGAKAVKAFQDTALSAGKLSDATGLAIQDASRWREVAADLSVSVDSIGPAINRMNRAAASGALTELGITAKNTNDQFIAVLKYLNGIPDAAKRAAEGTRLLGKGWQELAPLVAKAGELRQRLDDVSEAKVIDEAERRKAEELRDSLDALKDSVEDVALAFGESLAPGIAQSAAAAAKAVPQFVEAGRTITGANAMEQGGWAEGTTVWDIMSGKAKKAGDVAEESARKVNDALAVQNVADYYNRMAWAAEDATYRQDQLREGMRSAKEHARDTAQAVKGLADAERDAADAADQMARAHETLADATIDVEDAGRKFAETLQDQEATASDARDAAVRLAKASADQAAAQAAANGQAFTAADRQRTLTGALLVTAQTAKGPARQAILDYIGTLGQIPPNKMTAIRAAVDGGDIARANRILDILTQQRNVVVKVQLQGTSVLGGLPGGVKYNAEGGNLRPGELGVVSETYEPEIVRQNGRAMVTTTPTLLQGPAQITGVRDTARVFGGSGNSRADGSTTIVVPLYIDSRKVGEAIARLDKGMR